MNTARQQPLRLCIENAYVDFSRHASSMKDFLPEQKEGDHYHSDQWCFHLIRSEVSNFLAACRAIRASSSLPSPPPAFALLRHGKEEERERKPEASRQPVQSFPSPP